MTSDAAEAETVDSQPVAGFRRPALAFVGFFLLMTSYYILRPIREEMAVRTSVQRLPWLSTATFLGSLVVVPLFGWAVQRVSRAYLLQGVYAFLVLCLAGFYVAFSTEVSEAGAATFYIWLSIVNLFVVSLFWSNVSDAFTTDEARRYYGPIAAGGTLGAMTGPAFTALLSRRMSTADLLLPAALLLAVGAACMAALRRGAPLEKRATQRPIGGSIWAGITLTLRRPELRSLALFTVCYSAVSTTLYLKMNTLVRASYHDSGERTALFASFDLAVNVLALILQVSVAPWVAQRLGLRAMLSLAQAVVAVGLIVVGVRPTVWGNAVVQIVHRAGEFSLAKPGREIIYTATDEESRYKAKNFIDTTVNRGSDAAFSWIVTQLASVGLNASLLLALPAAVVGGILGNRLGRRHDRY